MSIPEARKHFFKYVHGFSVRYEYMASADGPAFRKECKKEGKAMCVFTVNGKEEMRNCARWGVQSVISDKPDQWREIKKEVSPFSKLFFTRRFAFWRRWWSDWMLI